jgi:hypothetical protein
MPRSGYFEQNTAVVQVFQQTALMFAVKDECVFRPPAATGADFVLAGGQGRRQDPKTPV